MRAHNVLSRSAFLLAVFLTAGGVSDAVRASIHDGSAILRMCQGADKVKALSMMCHSYLNGYLDTTAWQVGQAGRKPTYCLDSHAKEALPGKLVLWLKAHPADHAVAAPELLGRALRDLYPCR